MLLLIVGRRVALRSWDRLGRRSDASGRRIDGKSLPLLDLRSQTSPRTW